MHHILVSSCTGSLRRSQWEYVDRLARNIATLPHHTSNKQRPRRGLQLRIDWHPLKERTRVFQLPHACVSTFPL